MQPDALHEARRQVEICNACRYCEGYCSVFPAIHRQRAFSDGDLTQFANLCHNCRGCYYACQYTEPHAFAVNLPRALAELRRESWERFAWPSRFAAAFQRSGVPIALATVAGFALTFWVARALGEAGGDGFYAVLSHGAMIAIFTPAFLLPLVSLAVSLRRYWHAVGGARVRLVDVLDALRSAANMRELAGGHGNGCNFEDEDRFSHARRYAHQTVLAGFLLCFASTAAGTVLHYGFDMPAPYPLWSVPKLFGVPGGLLLAGGTLWMAWLKLRADRVPADTLAWGGEIGFILLLCFVAASGLVLYWLRETSTMPMLLAVHLGAVLSFFLLTPFSKMAHGFYRTAALIRDAQARRVSTAASADSGGRL